MSAYARSCGGNATCGGEDIRVLEVEDVISWLEAWDLTDELEEHFGDAIQDA